MYQQEETFKCSVIADLASAVDGCMDKIEILGLEAGSIIVKTLLAPGAVKIVVAGFSKCVCKYMHEQD